MISSRLSLLLAHAVSSGSSSWRIWYQTLFPPQHTLSNVSFRAKAVGRSALFSTNPLPFVPALLTFIAATLPHPDGSLVRPDVLLTLPNPIGSIAVDAKFPLDAFQDLLSVTSSDSTTLKASQSLARKRFKVKLDEDRGQ
jgi:hypothetical protein